ncbi:unnamed protein product [Pieris brassicae]|uniref:Uncharacterized protein n=1 Tax=Pieris brassicae TaxID=7116 RepID=A0A9P0X8V6_PIEBR|nr:unnamed protein product [Pieris brassicae]
MRRKAVISFNRVLNLCPYYMVAATFHPELEAKTNANPLVEERLNMENRNARPETTSEMPIVDEQTQETVKLSFKDFALSTGGSVALLWKPLSMATGIGRKIQDGGSISIDGESFPTPY